MCEGGFLIRGGVYKPSLVSQAIMNFFRTKNIITYGTGYFRLVLVSLSGMHGTTNEIAVIVKCHGPAAKLLLATKKV